MKKIFICMALAGCSLSICADDIAVEPSRRAPYGLTWQQYNEIRAEGYRSANHDLVDFRQFVDGAGDELSEDFQTISYALMDQIESGSNAVNEHMRGEFCKIIDNIESLDVMNDPLFSKKLADQFLKISSQPMVLKARRSSTDISAPWMIEQYPLVWVVLKSWVYCKSFYQGEYLRSPPIED